MRSCFFIGHREAPSKILPLLTDVVKQHIAEYGINEFIVGRYGRFDHLAAQAVMAAKNGFPNVKLFLLLPYHPSERSVEIPNGFDGTIYPSGMERTPRRYAIIRANRQMIKQADCLIAYVTHPASNASQFLSFARRLEKKGQIRVTNIGETPGFSP